MSPWPTLVIQGVFVEQANCVCYLLCSRFISENCIVPPFGEQVMERGAKQRDCNSPSFWWCCAALLKGSHILPVILTLNLTCQQAVCVHFLYLVISGASDCVFCECFKHVKKSCRHVTSPSCLSVNFNPLTQPVCWTHSSHRHVLGRQTEGGACGSGLLKSLNIHRHDFS